MVSRDLDKTELTGWVIVEEALVMGAYRIPLLASRTVCDICRGCAGEIPGEDLMSTGESLSVTAKGH